MVKASAVPAPVLMDGMLVNSCLVPALQAQGANIVTIEGLGRLTKSARTLQQAFLECGGAQCGICTPGMILAVRSSVERKTRIPRWKRFAKGYPEISAAARATAKFLKPWRRAARRRIDNMRSNPAEYEMVAPGSLLALLSLLAEEPGAWLPIAGGTDVMVQYPPGSCRRGNWSAFGIFQSCGASKSAADEIRIGGGMHVHGFARRTR